MSEPALVAATSIEEDASKEIRITLVMPDTMWYWWELIKSGLARMEHHFAPTDGEPMRELAHNILTGKLYAYIASEITDGDLEKPNPMAMVVLAPATDVGTNGKVLWIYAMYAFQSPIPEEVFKRGGDLIKNMAKQFGCSKIIADVQDKQMMRYVRALKWFDREVTMFVLEV